MSKAVLGIDSGTSKIAVALIDPDRGEVVATRSAEHHADIACDTSSRREQDVVTTARVVRALVTEMMRAHRIPLAAVGVTGQAHGILGLDRHGHPLTSYVTWEDGRGHEQIGPGTTLLEEIRERAGGDPKLATGYGIVTLYSWRRQGLLSGIARVCGIVDYLCLILTGAKVPATDHTMAETTGMFRLIEKRWDSALLDALEIPISLLPELLPPTTIAGTVKAPWLLELSGNHEVPVCVAIGDNQAGYLGAVREPFKSFLVNIGTGSQISVAIAGEPPAALDGLIDGYDVTLRPFVDSCHLVAGSALSGGVAYRALKEFFAAAGRELFGVAEPSDLYERMEILAVGEGGAAGVQVEPLFSGSRANPAGRGSIGGLSFENFKPGPLIYATQQGIIRLLSDMFGRRLLADRPRLVGSGNGLRRNPLLRRIASTVFERELLIPCIAEEAAVGAGLNAAVAAAVFSDFGEAREIIRYEGD
jgi:sedoheptulokinase